MRLKEIVAEHLYLKDANCKPEVLFKEQDSNVRGFYHKEASKVLYHLISSYLSSKGNLHKVINGAVKSFLDAHYELTKQNMGSLARRIEQAIKNNIKVSENE